MSDDRAWPWHTAPARWLNRRSAVPALDGGDAAVVGEDRDARGLEVEVRAQLDRLVDPARGEAAQDVPVGEHEAAPAGGPQPVDDAPDAGRDVGRRLAAGRAVGPEVPVRPLGADVGAGT